MSVPSMACVLGKAVQSERKTTAQLDHLQQYGDSRSCQVISQFLQDHTNLRRDQLSATQLSELTSQAKRVSYIVMEQVFKKVESEVQLHLVRVKGKSNQSSVRWMKISRATSEFLYDDDQTQGRRNIYLSTKAPISWFHTIEAGLPSGWSGPRSGQIMAEFKEAGCPATKVFSFTLTASRSSGKREGDLAVDQLVFSFTKEEEYSAWFDYLQNRMESSVSMSQVQLSCHSLFQVYALLAINHGISCIEREMSNYQPPLPPLPSQDYCDSEPMAPASSIRQFIQRRPTWIECMDSPVVEDMTDLDLDRIVDDKLKQSQRTYSSEEESPPRPEEVLQEEQPPPTPEKSPRREDGVGGWIRANSARTRRTFLSPRKGNN